MRCRMKACFMWLFLAVFCLQGLSTAIAQQHSKCFQEHEHPSDAPEPCDVAAWTEFDGVLTTIAPHIAFEIRGLEDCKRACLRTFPGCTAVDVYPNITLCFYHLRPIHELELNRFTARLPGYKQLVLDRSICSSESDIKTDETTDSTISPMNGNTSCTRQWSFTRDVHSRGYHTHLGVYGEEECKKDCIENIRGCVGIETLRQFDSCNYFTQSVEEVIKLRVPMVGNTQQMLTQECHPYYDNNNDETDRQTQQPVTSSNFTVAYNETLPSKGSAACSANWTKVPDVLSLLYHRHPKAKGREACQKACFEIIPQCVAITMQEIDEIPLNRTECMYFLEPLSRVISNRMPLKGYSQYVLTRDCPPPHPPHPHTPANSKRTDEITPQNVTIISRNETAKQACSWEEYKDTFSDGATPYAEVSGIEACKTACLQTITDCVAVDDHASSVCWYHKQQSNFESKRQSFPGNGLTQYVRVCSADHRSYYKS